MSKVRTVLSEKVRKRMSDKVHFKRTAGKIDMKKIMIAKVRRQK